jgi:hypothetical protein
LDRTTIKSTASHKFLGVIINQELNWKEHEAYAIGKGSKWVSQIARLSRTASGISLQQMRQMYLTAAVPKMAYAADVWYRPIKETKSGKRTGSIGVTKKLATIQRTAALTITGALRSTATDSLDVHAHLMPVDLLMKKICHRAATRLISLPETHPLHKQIKHCKK